jgi:PAS domain S-box-containing protein
MLEPRGIKGASFAEQRWQLLFEQSPLSIQIFSPDGQTIRFNRAWSRLFGLSDDEAYAFNVLKDPTLKGSGALAFIRRAFAGDVVFVPPVQFPVRKNPSDLRWIGGTLYPVITPDGVLREVVVIHHDITELKQAEEIQRNLNILLEARVAERTTELRKSEEELLKALDAERELNLLKTSFVGMVSHEFRTPLGVIQSAADLLQRHHDKLDAGQYHRQVQAIQNAVQRMAGMMEHILLLGRLDSQQYQPRWTTIDLPAWLDRNLELLCPSPADRARITFAVDDAPSLHAARMDETLLHHIVGNLLSNGCKFSPPDAPVTVRMAINGSSLLVSVEDRGIGIEEAEQSRLFEGFFRASNVGNRPGSGLGLTIAQRCLHRMGGYLTLTSRLGEGSAFHVHLPMPEGNTP